MPSVIMFRPHLLTLAVRSAMLLPVTLLNPFASVAWAQAVETTQMFDIAAGPLSTALTQVAAQTGISLSANAALIGDKKAAALKGRYSAQQALHTLLLNSGLALKQTGDTHFTVVLADREQNVQQMPQQTETLPEVNVTSTKVRELDPASERTRSYAAHAVTVGKGVQSIKELPQSVSVVTRQRMDEQNLTTLDSVLSQVTGVTKEFRNYGHTVYYSRGFALDNFMIDGVPIGQYGGIGIAPDTAIFDRVEVLRGAPGVLIGNGDPSGTVNMVRKRPLGERKTQLTGRAGSWDYYRLDADVTGSLNEENKLRGRLIAAYEDRAYFYDEAQSKLPLLYGMLEADLGESTVAAIGMRYQHYSQQGGRWAQGLPYSNNGDDLHLSRSTSYGPAWTYFKSSVREIFGDITHHINDDWYVKLSGTYQLSQRQDAAMITTASALPIDPRTLKTFALRGVDFEDSQYRRSGVDAQLHGNFDAWGHEHQMFIGANWQRQETLAYKASRALYASPLIVNPSSPDLSSLPDILNPGYGKSQNSMTTTQGIYGNVKLQVADPLKVILGSRITWYQNNNLDGSESKENREITPYLAAILRLSDHWSLYGSYTDIFRPQSDAYTASGSTLKPAIGSNYELGIKSEFDGGRLNTSFAIFRIDLADIAQTDPQNPLSCPGTPASGGCSINGGELQSEGFDAEVNGEILPRLQLFAGYTYNAAKYVRDRDSNGNPTANEGNAYQSAFMPRQLLRSWLTYKLPGDWDRLTVGGGVNMQSEIYNDISGVHYTQGGYAVWNAYANYLIDHRWTATLNINNIFDKHYYTIASNRFYGEPQSFMLTLRGSF